MHVLYVTDAEVTVPLGNGKILFHKSCTKRIRRTLLQTGFPCSIYDLKRTGWGFPILSSARYTATPPTASKKNIFIPVIDKRNLLSSFCLHTAPRLYLFTKKPVTNLIPNQLNLNPRHISSSCTLLCQR